MGDLAHASAIARKAAAQVRLQMWAEAALCKKRSRTPSEDLFAEESDDPARELLVGELHGSPADE